MSISKYLQIAKTSWENSLVYRLNFLMWRVRNVVQLLTLYFLWVSVAQGEGQVFSYTTSGILTYILGSSIIRAVVLSSRSIDAQGEISSGDLNNQLLKPVNYFLYWVFRDLSDKSLNIVFSFVEVTILWIILKPSIIIQSQPTTLLLFLLSLIFATILFFIFSFIISMTTFWYYQFNGWAQRFLSFVFIESLAGGLFPLDILPQPFAAIANLLPTAYLIFFPMQIYLDRISSSEIARGFIVMIFWITVLYLLSQHLWKKGLKIYGAYGR